MLQLRVERPERRVELAEVAREPAAQAVDRGQHLPGRARTERRERLAELLRQEAEQAHGVAWARALAGRRLQRRLGLGLVGNGRPLGRGAADGLHERAADGLPGGVHRPGRLLERGRGRRRRDRPEQARVALDRGREQAPRMGGVD